ncbi:hypothetical protein EUBSIR_02125 [[Eubacterium] siraeum DSM 15702]|uniref:Uncharacterized protein n=1 Tax=[Eubacterium] siraeum DSM 15702 TaxID=428128 RepID=B0MQK9_9FIRM|nr:hypothetical protein EUBSIR_02125 [[Eubacterium] siraeum DSM 15702]
MTFSFLLTFHNFVTKGSQTALLRQMAIKSGFVRILFDTVI